MSSSTLSAPSSTIETAPGSDPERTVTLVDLLLRDQADLTAVERFSRVHEAAEGDETAASALAEASSRRYEALLPASPPGPGQQYAFEVDLDRCSGCKACVTACHSLNGLDEGEAWREVGLLVGGAAERPLLRHVTTACHHCLDPGCLNACPVDAYEKDPITGIVRHLDDQCIGCKYCTLACPYDVPKYHQGLGIVRKCDMCADRLGAGEAPACAQACPHEAIRIRVVDEADIRADEEFLPGAPEPSHTRPTTRYRSSEPLPSGLRGADASAVRPAHAHLSLILMLVLTQAAVGAFLVEGLSRAFAGAPTSRWLGPAALVLLISGLAASLAHLGRPLFAFRALIGLRHSWLSREVAVFGAFVPLAILQIWASSYAESSGSGWAGVGLGISVLAAAVGLAGVGCSVMIYHVVNRPLWHVLRSGPRFFGTAALLGLAVALAVSSADGAPFGDSAILKWGIGLVVPAVALFKLIGEVEALRHLRDPEPTHLKRTALLMTGRFAHVTAARWLAGLAGGVVLPPLLVASGALERPEVLPAAALILLVVLGFGELMERFLFFATVSEPKMPGGATS